MNCGVGHRHGSDLALLWLWCRPTATAPIRPLAWELPHPLGAALERQKKNAERKYVGVITTVWWNLKGFPPPLIIHLFVIWLNYFVIYKLKKKILGRSHCGSGEPNPTSIHKDVGSIPGLTQWVKGSSIAVAVV